jgi:hypothetical protein
MNAKSRVQFATPAPRSALYTPKELGDHKPLGYEEEAYCRLPEEINASHM